MADELDPRFEASLRAVLRAEADSVPFTLRAEQVAMRLAERRRARDRRRFGVMAAVALIAVGVAAVGLSWGRNLGPAAVSPSPSPAASDAASASPEPTPIAADCIPHDDAAVVPALDVVDGTGAFRTAGDLVYDRRSDGTETGDPNAWAVSDSAATTPFADGLVVDAGDACVTAWDVRIGSTAAIRADLDAGRTPDAEAYQVSGGGDGHTLIFNGLPEGDVLVRVRATWYSTAADPPVTVRVYRLQNQAVAPEPSVEASADRDPALPRRQRGETTLLEFPVQGGEAPSGHSATIPAGTDWYFVTLDCVGSGTVTLDIDGVRWPFPCQGTALTTAAPGADDTLEVTASADGSARAVVQIGAVDLRDIPNTTFVPPTLRVTGPDATSGNEASVNGFVGCGLSWIPKRGGGFSDDCGPSWQPIAAALRQRTGSSVSLALGGGWEITGVGASVAANDEILPSQDPASAPLDVRREGGGYAFDVPGPGDWGIRLGIHGTKDGDAFSVPYYTRLIVEP
jgi:hypothetical protein